MENKEKYSYCREDTGIDSNNGSEVEEEPPGKYALYGDMEEVMADTVITYRDGRTRDVKIPIRIARIE